MLGEEIQHIEDLLTAPPDELVEPHKHEAAEREALQRERDDLVGQMKTAARNVLLCEQKELRAELDSMYAEMTTRLQELDAQLADEVSVSDGYSREDVQALSDWWKEFQEQAVSVPVPLGKASDYAATFYQDPFSDEQAVLIDAKRVNQALKELDAKVTLLWETEVRSDGKKRHRLVRGRFQLGQKKGQVPASIFCYGKQATATSWALGWKPNCQRSKSTGRDSNPRRRITKAVSSPLDHRCVFLCGWPMLFPI